MTTLLADPYYSQCHEVFRRATNQTDLMLDQLVARTPLIGAPGIGLSICSVGCGAGLFELPMLERLGRDGIDVTDFVGVDVSAHASAILDEKLARAAFPDLDYELVIAPFETYEPDRRFDLMLFNHVIEYVREEPTRWLVKAAQMVSHRGAALAFSPTRGGINRPYEETFIEFTGAPPLFADDLDRMLRDAGIDFVGETVTATCDVSLLDRPDRDTERTQLLSFLTQRDCRRIDDETLMGYVDYYQSLRPDGVDGIDHPTTVFAW